MKIRFGLAVLVTVLSLGAVFVSCSNSACGGGDHSPYGLYR